MIDPDVAAGIRQAAKEEHRPAWDVMEEAGGSLFNQEPPDNLLRIDIDRIGCHQPTPFD
ncbi:MAG: hypothetical protein KGL35_29810 [Bradyrhizobium sp.]|uniref:hypothetical protein n=1 Tax=Bradyrhizobium sp. TaxID=376 RepID=UPI001C28ED81|nr:hypothetical protein [Bradyrhizobium sp.]MBU6461365.1 hypothetical protein [Pseudomonadota bacterium]MDE2066541.1 hypothetical protein [Bradyrhizobium sp.]MDE2472804.1 hypothetical protein [Bradyrhizobium sp.]